jgi:2-keto-4-pentenoate hydratase
MALAMSGAEQVGGALGKAERGLAADALYLAELNRRPISPLRRQFPEISVADAYKIQLINVQRRVNDGAVVRGHKVGLSSRVMQQMMQTHEPDYGHLLSDMFIAENTPIETSTLCAPRVEVVLGSVTTRFD